MQRARERAITDDTNVDERYDSLRPDGPARDRRNKGRRPRAAMLGVCRVWPPDPREPALGTKGTKGSQRQSQNQHSRQPLALLSSDMANSYASVWVSLSSLS
jgi:hypothetical protein